MRLIHTRDIESLVSAQAIKDQLDRDKSVIELMEAMEDTYSFVDELKSFPEKIELLKTIIKEILDETYGTCMLHALSLASDADILQQTALSF